MCEPGFWYLLSQVALFWHLIALFSILLKRGGLLLAVVAMFVVNQVAMPFTMFLLVGGPELYFTCSAVFFAVLTLVVLRLIAGSLRKAAASA